MRAILMVAVLVAGCGGPDLKSAILNAPEAGSVGVGCETNLDAGTPCDPCQGATGSEQHESGGYTWRSCYCQPGPDKAPQLIAWSSCPAPAPAPSCEYVRERMWRSALELCATE